jgi:hypothetical protein
MDDHRTAEEALVRFLSKALQPRWRERYVELIRSKRGKKVFLADLCHRVEDVLDPAKAVPDLLESVWKSPAFSFSERHGFGREEESVRAAFDSVGDGSLIIDRAGKHGIHQPEDMIDDVTFFCV